MKRTCQNVFTEVEKRRQITLQHAVEISPFVTERTLGPDIIVRETEPEDVGSNKRGPAAVVDQLLVPVTFTQSIHPEQICSSVIIREAERKRQALLRQALADRQQSQRVMLTQLREVAQKNTTRRNVRNEEELIKQAEEEAAKELTQQQQQMEALRQQTKRELQAITFKGIVHYQRLFRAKYENVAKQLIANDRQALPSCSEHNAKLKELVQTFEQLIMKIKGGDCGQAELKVAAKLCRNVDELEVAINDELQQQHQKKEEAATAAAHAAAAATAAAENHAKEEAIAAAEAVARASAEAAAAAAAAAAEVSATAAAAAAAITTEDMPQFYTEIMSFYLKKLEKVQYINDDTMKPYRFACQKAINIPVNAISAVSGEHLQDKFEKLYSFISGQPDKGISVQDHPVGRDFCLLTLAKKFVSQGETAISSNPKAAFPVASVIVSLWKRVPEFGKLFLASVFEKSPLLVPKAGANSGDLKSQAGIARLYGAVMITAGRQADGPTHPFDLSNCWRWLAAFVDMEPQQDISATLLVEMLQVVGADMYATYSKQFIKLLLYLSQNYLPRLAGVDEGGPKARLQMLLEGYFRQPITRPQGVIPPNFW